jgi:fumarate hydratase class II
MTDTKYREEKDSMGTVKLPFNAYYGPNTQRAKENFPVSNITFPAIFIHTIALIKKSASTVNCRLGLLDKKVSEAVCLAAQEILDGKYDDEFIVDIFQTGSGTSTNMNVNEVIATRANEILTGKKSCNNPVHPNDHVNMGQSSNDVIPTAIHVSAFSSLKNSLVPSLVLLHNSLLKKSDEFAEIKKIGRTHLQDAVPITLGQEFSGYARQVELGIKRIKTAGEELTEVALGGTAVGSGLNTHKDFAVNVIDLLSEHTGISLREAENHFEAQSAQDAAVNMSGALKSLAVSLVKIANDIRLLASGPRCGLGEITLPSLQPGSSIMPGKINPVIPESVIQVAAQVMGNDTAVMLGGQWGYFELNTMLPLIAHNLLQSIELLSTSSKLFAEKCINDITANAENCAENIEKSLAMATYLVPHIGYDRAALIAKKAFETGKTVREIAKEEGLEGKCEVSKV